MASIRFASRFVIPLTALTLLQSCASLDKSDLGPPETSLEALKELSKPNKDSNLETIAIVGTNDLHGSLLPQNYQTEETQGGSKVKYDRGGVTLFAAQLKTLRQEWGSRLVYLDAGDEFQGSLESNSQMGAPTIDLMNRLGLGASAVGNHEFDFGLSVLKDRMKQAKYPFLSANILDKKTGKTPELTNLLPHTILKVGRAKLGVIGLTTLETPHATITDNVKDFDFADLAQQTIKSSKELKRLGAQAVVVLSHAGLRCELAPVLKSMLRKPDDIQGDCDSDEEITHLLKQLPSGTIDGVIAGHRHFIAHHWLPVASNGTKVPVIESGSRLGQFHVLYLTVDLKAGRARPELAKIEGPIQVCPQVFKNQNDCNGDRPAPRSGRGSLTDPTFRGEPLTADSDIEKFVKEVTEKTEVEKKKVVGHLKKRLVHTRDFESPLGQYTTDAMRATTGADVALMNRGGIRVDLPEGDVTFGDVFQAFPFENVLTVVKVKGAKLKKILQVAENGHLGVFPVSGVKLRIIGLDYEASGKDLDGSRKVEPWEIDRLIEARLEDGTKIQDGKTYRLAVPDFLYAGGDDMGWVLKGLETEKADTPPILVRDMIVKFLGQPLEWKSSGPRIVQEHPPAKKIRGRGGRRGRKS